MRTLTLSLLILSAAFKVAAAEQSFYDRFLEASEKQKGFLWDASLIASNNYGPTNAVFSFSRLATNGELGGIKLGMTMSEAVAAWGKPSSLITHCFVGPRLYYGTNKYSGDLSLFFIGDRLVYISIYGSRADRIVFDNGLTGSMSRSDCEKLLGEPAVRDPDDRYANLSYRTGDVRTDLSFCRASQPGSAKPPGHVCVMAVYLEPEVVMRKPAEPNRPPNAAPADK